MTAEAPYRDASLAPEERVEDLLGRMTLGEKLAQLGCVWSTSLVLDDAFSAERARRHLPDGIGQITRIASSTGLRPTGSAAFANAIQRFCIDETRLGIPAIIHEESTAGFCARDATQFPQAIGLAATWSPELVERMAGVIREQMRAVGARHTLAPVLDVARDPRWGRLEETYGESAYLAARLGVAYVRGLQTPDLREGVAATGKHFLGYGLSEGGLNHAPVHLGARELREVFAEPFRAAIHEAGLATVMNAYNSVDGLPCGASAAILDELLRGELGFAGVVVADYFTTALLITHHRTAADRGEAGRRALAAGLDMELPALDCYGAPLEEEIAAGRLAESLVDRSVRRVLRLKLSLGLFERPYVDEGAAALAYGTGEQRELARELARRSVVVLRNDRGLLPLDPARGPVAVIGPAADDVRLLQGDYHYPAHMEIVYKNRPADPGAASILPAAGGAFAPGPYFPPSVTLLDGVRATVRSGVEVRHAQGCAVTGDDASGIQAAVAAVRGATVAIVCVGGKSGLLADCTVGEFRDATSLRLTGVQQRLVEEVIATGTPTVVVVVSGRVHALPWAADHAAALVTAWVPGEQGGHGVADVLFGAADASGRLPVTIPRSAGQIPSHHDHRAGGGRSQMLGDYADGPVAPLFPFGHGCSYTTFAYSGLEVAAARTDAPFSVAVSITNTGARPGTETLQLYLRDRVARVARPDRTLAGFARVDLSLGETARIELLVDPSRLAYYDEAMRLVIEPGEIDVLVGSSAAAIQLSATVAMRGPERVLTPADLVPTIVQRARPAR